MPAPPKDKSPGSPDLPGSPGVFEPRARSETSSSFQIWTLPTRLEATAYTEGCKSKDKSMRMAVFRVRS